MDFGCYFIVNESDFSSCVACFWHNMAGTDHFVHPTLSGTSILVVALIANLHTSDAGAFSWSLMVGDVTMKGTGVLWWRCGNLTEKLISKKTIKSSSSSDSSLLRSTITRNSMSWADPRWTHGSWFVGGIGPPEVLGPNQTSRSDVMVYFVLKGFPRSRKDEWLRKGCDGCCACCCWPKRTQRSWWTKR